MTASETVDITSRAFALRLGNLLVATRTRDGRGVGAVARASGGTFSKHDLRAYEEAGRTLDEATMDELAQLYRCDLGEILPLRLPVVVSPSRVSAGGVYQEFEPSSENSVLAAYLMLVRTLRHEKKSPVVDLRRDDIEVLAGFLHEPSQTVIEHLAALMGATQSKRTAMLGVFATGAVVIGLVGTSFAVSGSAVAPGDTRPDTRSGTTVVAATTTTIDSSAPIATNTSTVPSTAAVATTPVATVGVAPSAAPVPSTTSATAPAPPRTTLPALIESTLAPTTTATVDVGTPPLP